MTKPSALRGDARGDRLAATLRFAAALCIGGAGGFILYELHAPLAWMLGSMLACGIAALLRVPISTPATARTPFTALIGTMLGTSITANTFEGASQWLIPLAGLSFFVLTGVMTSYVYFRRVGGFDQATAFFAGLPGGLVEMVTLGGERGGDERLIALVHSARIFLVVFSLPFAIQTALGVSIPRTGGAFVPLSVLSVENTLWFVFTYLFGIVLGQVFRLPARFMFGPLIASAIVHFFAFSDFRLPTVLVSIAQVVIGSAIGCRFVGTEPRLILRVLALSVGSTALLLGVTFTFGLAIAAISGESLVNVVLAYSPGGLTEMSLIAIALGGEVAFVVFHHIVRVLIVVAFSAMLFGLISRSRPPAPGATTPGERPAGDARSDE